jgi:L-threonylcarbamoyladenylate synthase
LTLVLPVLRPELVPEALSAGRATLAVRIPDHPVPRALARHLGPIAVTAADPGATAPSRTATELVAVAGASLALVLDAGPVRDGVPSTVVQVDADDRCIVLREVALEAADILAVAGPA